MNNEQIAKVAHEVNAAFCTAFGDDSQPSWEDAPQWQRDSALDGVEFHILNPAAEPSQSHENWMAEKEAAGWVFGRVKDPEEKEHPCIVPFEELPPEQKAKDYLFRQVVHSLT
jgi:RyR domain